MAAFATRRRPSTIPSCGTLDLTRPTALVLAAVLHFVPDDTEAYELVEHPLAVLPRGGSYLVI